MDVSKSNKSNLLSKTAVRCIAGLYATGLLAMIFLAVAYYPVQWRSQVDRERYRSLEVLAQALEYYYLDHDSTIFDLPAEPALISNLASCALYCPTLRKELACFDMQRNLVPDYVKELPQDPLLTSQFDSGIYIKKTDSGFMLGSCRRFFRPDIVIETSLGR